MKPKDWFRHFFLYIYFIIFFFSSDSKLRGTRHLATRLQNTLQWPHFGPTVQPLGDPWAKWSQRTGLDNFYFIFGFKWRGTRHLATWLQNTLQWPHFGPTVQPLGDPWAKWSQRTGLDNFYFIFGLKLRGTRHLATWLQNTLQWPHFGPTVQPSGDPWALEKMKPKDWLRHFFSFFILFSDSSCKEQDIWLHGYKIPSSDPTSGQQYNRQATLGQNEAKGLV